MSVHADNELLSGHGFGENDTQALDDTSPTATDCPDGVGSDEAGLGFDGFGFDELAMDDEALISITRSP